MRANQCLGIAALVAILGGMPALSDAGHHQWKINEVFSNADGTVQFIELVDCCNSEAGLNTHFLTSNGDAFMFDSNLSSTATANTTVLIATTAFAALPGAPAPDYTLPDGFINSSGDTIAYVNDSGGVPGAVLDSVVYASFPTDGITSLDDASNPANNTPKNFNGDTATILVAPAVPAFSAGAVVVLAVLLLAGIAAYLSGARRASA